MPEFNGINYDIESTYTIREGRWHAYKHECMVDEKPTGKTIIKQVSENEIVVRIPRSEWTQRNVDNLAISFMLENGIDTPVSPSMLHL